MEENMMQTEQVSLEEVRAMVNEMLRQMQEEWQKKANERMLLEGMTEEQKQDYAMSQREKALQEREKRLMQMELKQKAVQKLQDKGLPKELAEALPYESEAECMNALDQLELIFRKAVQQSVDEKLRGSVPASGAGLTTDADNLSDQDYYAKMIQI